MKFGIITLVSDNYGNKFQNYAVEQLLSEYGEVETFGLANLYHRPQSEDKSALAKLNPKYIKEVLISRPMYQYDITSIDKGILHNYLYGKQHSAELLALRQKRSQRFQEFSSKYLHISDTVLNRENTTIEWAEKFDYFICGSDQIWNPSYATTSELAFCSFAPEKTICLSPSFGVSEIPAYRKKEYSEWLTKLKSLSVREQAGQKIIQELTGREAPVLVDPTMALPIDKWEQLCKAPMAQLPEHYITCYFLGRIDKVYRKRIAEFSAKMNLPVVVLFDILTPQYYTMDPSEVLYTVKHADYVLTDSFHGTVFSILFQRNFYVFERSEGGASMKSRIDTLLETFSLTDRIFSSRSFRSISADEWNNISNTLKDKQIQAHLYLNGSFV